MNVLITGASGFVGRHVLSALQGGGHSLSVIGRNCRSSLAHYPSVTFIEADLSNPSTWRKGVAEIAPDACIHLAWQGIPDYSPEISKKNLSQSIDLIDFLVGETKCRKIIISGSCFEYGKIEGECLESEQVRTASFIAWAKQSLYNYASLLCEKSAIDLVWFRIFYVYGPGQRSNALIPSLLKAFLDGKQPSIGNPLNKNDFVYVGDVAEAIRLALEMKVAPGIFNLGSGTVSSVSDICRLVEQEVLGTNEFHRSLEQVEPREHMCFWANREKAKAVIGWEPKNDLRMGIRQCLEAMQEVKVRQQP